MPAVSETPELARAQLSPYVGAAPFERGDRYRFFGRDREAENLVSLIIAHPVVLLYAQSGAGKTSLINARLIPALEEEDCEVLPPVRVGGLRSLAGLLANDENAGTGEPRPRVVIFDQFEELFTNCYHYSHVDRVSFFQEIRAALGRNRLLRILICLREDYIAQLEPYARYLADGFRTRVRLERLRPAAALRALTGPLEGTVYRFAAGVAEKFVTNLLKVHWTDRDGRACEMEGEFVEPVQLGVISEFLWARIVNAGATLITDGFVGPAAGIDEALEQFYEHCINDVLRRFPHVEETTLRRFFQHHLIREGGIRAMCLKGHWVTEGVPNPALERLDELHLIRSEWRANAEWYELTHDRFISPVQQANRGWMAERLRPEELDKRDRLETAAAQWQARGRRDVDRLGNEDLNCAETLLLSPALAELGLSETLRSCIEASRRVRHTKELKQLRRQRLLLCALVFCAIAGSVVSYREYARARLRTAEVEMGSALAETRRIELEAERASHLSSSQSAEVLRSQLPARREELRAARQELERAEQAAALIGVRRAGPTRETGDSRQVRLLGHVGQVFGVSYSGTGLLASASADWTTRVWNPSTGATVATLNGHSEIVTDAIFSRDGKLIATASHDGTARLWDASTGEQLRTFGPHESRVWDIAFSPDSRLVATASEDGAARVWETHTGTLVTQFSLPKQLFAVAFDTTGARLATGGADGVVRIWEVGRKGRPVMEFHEHSKWVWSVAFSPDGKSLASAGFDGKVIIFDLEREREPLVLKQDPRWQLGVVAFATRGTLIAVGSSKGSVAVWDYRSGKLVATLDGNCGPVYGVAFSPDGSSLAAGCQQGTVALFPSAWKIQ